ncbi:MAG: Rid family detoxifying hydrolase [Thermoleophilia bacterium]|nr:Rid family detoxifying hydrolase [Thermoleophilia bacterium]
MKSIRTADAPAPVHGSPYSQAIVASSGELVFISGQVPIDPLSGEIVSDEITAQTEQAMSNLLAILRASGGSIPEIVRCTIYLTDLDDFGAVNAAYGAALEGHTPARATVEVCALPLGAKVEIDAIAVLGG